MKRLCWAAIGPGWAVIGPAHLAEAVWIRMEQSKLLTEPNQIELVKLNQVKLIKIKPVDHDQSALSELQGWLAAALAPDLLQAGRWNSDRRWLYD